MSLYSYSLVVTEYTGQPHLGSAMKIKLSAITLQTAEI